MKQLMKLKPFLLALAALIIVACGGGGGGGGSTGTTGTTAQAVGRILNVVTGGPTNPQANVQIGSASTLTSAADGSFALTAPVGSTQVLVDTRSAFGTFTFTVPSLTGTIDVGDLWVGPEKVQLRGRVLNSTDGTPVSGATVSFAGRTGTTNAAGQFNLVDVAYSSTTQNAFWGIVGSVRKTDFFKTDFSAQPNVAVGGVVTVSDILITPSNDDTPPPAPFNIWGRVNPSAQAPGTVVTLKQNGNPVRIYNVGSDSSYFFWVGPGDYTIEFVKGNLTAQTSVTLTAANQVVRKDVTLQ